MADAEQIALYRAILAQPDEDTPRLVYADWLQENGDPERAEFIRVQCRLARANAWDEGFTADLYRADRLLRERWGDWGAPPGARRRNMRYLAGGFRAVRGFPGGVDFTSSVTPAEARRWFTPHPITEADINFGYALGGSEKLWRLTSDALPNLRSLALDCQYSCPPATRDAVCRALAGAGARAGLRWLEFKGDPTPAGLEALVTSLHLRGLDGLAVRGEEVGDEHACVLAERTDLPALRELVLGHRGMTAAGGAALGRAGWLDGLRAIALHAHEGLGDAGLDGLFARPLPNLRALTLRYCGSRGGDARLAGGATLPGLVDVTLEGRYMSAGDWRTLTSGPQRFCSLTLADLQLDEGGNLFDRPALADLRRLEWRGRWSVAALAELVHSPLTQSLRRLNIPFNLEADAGAIFLEGRDWPHLEHLGVGGRMPWKSVLALIESDKFSRLVSLSASCEDGWAKFLKALAKSPAAAKFRRLDLRAYLTPLAAQALVDSPHLSGLDSLVVHKGEAKPADCERLTQRFGKRIEIVGYYRVG